MDDAKNIQKAGWLFWKNKSKWERRYFVLHVNSNILYHYRSPKDAHNRAIALFLASTKQKLHAKKPFSFEIITREETCLLRAESDADMAEWISVLTDVSSRMLSASIDTGTASTSATSSASAISNTTTTSTASLAPSATPSQSVPAPSSSAVSPSIAPFAASAPHLAPGAAASGGVSRSSSNPAGAASTLAAVLNSSLAASPSSARSIVHTSPPSPAAHWVRPWSASVATAGEAAFPPPMFDPVAPEAPHAVRPAFAGTPRSKDAAKAAAKRPKSSHGNSTAQTLNLKHLHIEGTTRKKDKHSRAPVQGLQKSATLPAIMERDGNTECADCSAPLVAGNQYTSVSLGIFLCEECATIHRQLLGEGVSEVFSLNFDQPPPPQSPDALKLFDRLSNPHGVTFLSYMGNKQANAYWEPLAPAGAKPNAASARTDKEEYIYLKYLARRYKATKQGFLNLREKKKWREYWVVLESSTINLFTHSKDMKAAEIIVLASCGVKPTDDPSTPECFSVITPTRCFKFSASSFKVALEWLNLIKVSQGCVLRNLTAEAIRAEGESENAAAVASSSSASSNDGTEAATPSAADSSDSSSSSAVEPDAPAPVPVAFITRRLTLLPGLRTPPPVMTFVPPPEPEETEPEPTADSLLQRLSALESQAKEIEEARAQQARLMNESIARLKELEQEKANVTRDLLSASGKADANATSAIPGSNTPAGLDLNTINRAPLEQILQHLLWASRMFQVNFLLSYRTFTSPAFVLQSLATMYRAQVAQDAAQATRLCSRITAFLELWITRYFFDIDCDGSLATYIAAFIDDILVQTPNLEETTTHLRSLLRAQILHQYTIQAMFPEAEEAPPPPIEPSKSLETLLVYDIDPLELARQLTLIDHRQFRAIRPNELQRFIEWKSFDKAYQAPSIVTILERRELVASWVLENIVRSWITDHISSLEYFITVGKHLVSLRNLSGCAQILAAIDDTSLLRFDGLWESIGGDHEATLQELRRLISSDSHYKNARAIVSTNIRAPSVPYLEVILDDLQVILQSEAELDQECASNNAINLSKARKLARIIADVQYHQSIVYPLRAVPVVQLLLDNSRLQSLDAQARRLLAKLHSQLEPRGAVPLEFDDEDLDDLEYEFDDEDDATGAGESASDHQVTDDTPSRPAPEPPSEPAPTPNAPAPEPPASERLSIFTMFQ